MSHTEIDRGTGANNADGIPLYEAFGIINDNFDGLDTRLTVLESGNITITGDIDSTNISGENGFFGTVGMDPNTRSLTSYGSIGLANGQIEGVKTIEGDGTINITTTGNLGTNEVVNLQPGGNQTIIRLTADTIEVFGDLIPLQDEVYDIGSSTKRFKDLYLSGNTINLGGLEISNVGGELKLDGVKLITQSELDVAVQNDITTNLTGSVFADDSTLLVDGVAGKIVGPVEVSANGSIVFKTEQDTGTWSDGSIETTGYAYQLNFPTNQTSNTAPLIVGWNDYPYIQPYLPTDIGASEGSSGFVRRTIELRGGDATDTRAPGLLLLNGGSNSSAGLYGEVRINNVAGDVKIGNASGTTTIDGNTIASGQLTVEENYSATPTTKFFEIETGAGNNRLLRTGVNMSAFAQEFGPEIDLTSYRSSPANGDAGPGLVLRASTGASANDVIATIKTEVTDVTNGNVTSKISFTTKNNGSSVTPLTITGSTIDFANANVQNFAPGDIYANAGQYLYVISKRAGGSATNVAFTYDTNISNVRQIFYGKTEFANNGQAAIVDFDGATVKLPGFTSVDAQSEITLADEGGAGIRIENQSTSSDPITIVGSGDVSINSINGEVLIETDMNGLHSVFVNTGKLTLQQDYIRVITSPPASSKGLAGDEFGMFAFDAGYIYYCTTTYTDGVADIWKRVAWSGDTW